MSRTWSMTALVFSLVLAFALDALAQTRTETLRWTHDNPDEVTGYQVHYGPSPGDYTDHVEAGIPTPVSGVFEYQVQVDATADVYFAVTASNEYGPSDYSNERCRGPAGACAESPPPPPPAPSEAQAAVEGFALWNAESDTIIDPSFESGKQVRADDYSCVAIEIVGNSYLARSGPGSVKYSFDGQEPSSCNNPGRTHENSAPFAWEEDSGPGSFECAATLKQPGSHTLTVTPFDGDDCTGLQGTAVSLEFEVVTGAAAGTSPAALGQPGKPTLVGY